MGGIPASLPGALQHAGQKFRKISVRCVIQGIPAKNGLNDKIYSNTFSFNNETSYWPALSANRDPVSKSSPQSTSRPVLRRAGYIHRRKIIFPI
jgi:hypothetical protein